MVRPLTPQHRAYCPPSSSSGSRPLSPAPPGPCRPRKAVKRGVESWPEAGLLLRTTGWPAAARGRGAPSEPGLGAAQRRGVQVGPPEATAPTTVSPARALLRHLPSCRKACAGCRSMAERQSRRFEALASRRLAARLEVFDLVPQTILGRRDGGSPRAVPHAARSWTIRRRGGPRSGHMDIDRG